MKKFRFVPTLGAAAALLVFAPEVRADTDPFCATGVQIAFDACLSAGANIPNEAERYMQNAECAATRDREMEGCWVEPPPPELHCSMWTWSCWYC